MTTFTFGNDTAKPVVLPLITHPHDVATLSPAQRSMLAAEIRAHMIATVTATGGHLGASLGTVELTIALHTVFDSPRDVILFDTGHQCYAHKMLTGRAADFATLRQRGGLSGYPSRTESVHDWYESSHASGSIAFGNGIATGLHLREDTGRRVISIIGDGALTGGVAWEGLANLGATHLPVIIVLNDNGRSYDPTGGALGNHLTQLRDRTAGNSNLFEALGFDYIGPFDGHDIEATAAALRRARRSPGPVVVHAITQKGKGYPPAEADDADRMHACGVIHPASGQPLTPAAPTWTDAFADELAQMADRRADIHAITAAMRLPTGLGPMSAAHPDRVHDHGIAEQHALAHAAGLAAAGQHPVVALYSTFLARALDQALYDLGLHEAAVTLVLDRAGITGPDGPSHHGIWDMALLANVPGMRIAAPRDPARLRELLNEAVDLGTPTAIRFPKAAAGNDLPTDKRMDGMDILFRSPRLPLDVLFIAIGAMATPCLAAAAELTSLGIGSTVIDPRWVWPVNPRLLWHIARHQATITVEDGVVEGGIGSRILHTATTAAPHTPPTIRTLGVPSGYYPHAGRDPLLAHCGLTPPGLIDDARMALYSRPGGVPASPHAIRSTS